MIFSILNKIIFVLNIIAAACLLLSYLSPYTNPQKFWPIAFFGLAYPLLLGLNIAFVVYWLLRAKLWIFISLVPILLGAKYIGRYIQFHSSIDDPESISIISMNVKHFKGEEDHPFDSTFLKYLEKETPDIMVFQEYYTLMRKRKGEKHIKQKRELLPGKKYYEHMENSHAVISRYKILKSGFIAFDDKIKVNGVLWVDLLIKKDTIRLYNIHLQSFKLDPGLDIDRMDSEKALKESRNIFRRIKTGNYKRTSQAREVLEHMASCRHKIIIAGDFNDTPMSYTYDQFQKRFTDCFTECGKGLGSTYVGPYPSYRIDYIFHSPGIRGLSFKRGSNFESDHRMVTARLAL